MGAIELDGLAATTYRMNHPHVRVWEQDIRTVSVAEVKQEIGLTKGTLDLLAGCPPCQGFSTIRTLNGNREIRDRRNGLTDQFLRFVRGLVPKAVMLENVPGLAHRRRFREFALELEKLGYHINWEVLDASCYGVPQRRRRLILLAARSGQIAFAPVDKSIRTVSDAIGMLPAPAHAADPLHREFANRTERIAELIKLIPKDGGSRTDLPRSKWLECHKKCNGFKDVYGRMRWDDVAPTITGGCLNPSKGRFLHPDQDRPITAREASLLQGFPRRYQFATDRGMYAIARMIGNALPPEFVRRHALQVKTELRARLKR